MEMEEVESTWKALFQRRVVMAAKHCHSVHEQLLGVLEAEYADVQNRRRHQGQRALEGASMDLGLAVASMGAARHLALRGGAPCPSAPLDSVDDLAGEDPGVWCALEKLGNAAALATRVHDGVERARGHLRAAELLGFLDEASDGGGDGDGDGNTAPWEQSPCFCEQFSGAMALAEALPKAMDLATETDDAREAAFGFIGGVK
ncbi:uncharacterized protein [Miscanthus floridulus]|uniref:uncharacterized protein n=1 Tax=Miscanthus floridulus TaxID=154761 RepID=UPI00345B3CB1